MSQLKVNTIRHTGASSDAVTLASDGTCTAKITNQPPGNRNLIINGSMAINQRGNATGKTTGAYYGPDRWELVLNSLGAWDISQETSVVPNGFKTAYKLDCATADASPAADDLIRIHTRLEGQDLVSTAFGTSDAKSLTLSFWVRCTKTGAFNVNVANTDTGSNHTVGNLVTISSANTWEKKTITLPADTSNGFTYDHNMSMKIEFWLNAGSTYKGGTRPSTWTAQADNWRAEGNTLALGATTSDIFYITGVQLEVGDIATDFEHRSYGDELARCQRYFFNIKGDDDDSAGILGYALSTNEIRVKIDFPVPMRQMPGYVGNAKDCKFKASNVSSAMHWSDLSMINAHTTPNPSSSMMKFDKGSSLSITAGQCGDMEFHEDGGELQFSAEL